MVYEYGSWFSSDGENFSKVDEESNTFEVNNHCQLRYLGKGLQGFGIFQDDPTWGPLFDEIEQRRNAQIISSLLMWLWDSNILRYYFGEKHPILHLHLKQIFSDEIARTEVVIAEVLRGRCDFALKASPSQAPMAHQQLLQTQKLLSQFKVVVFDDKCAEILKTLQQKHKAHKRYPDRP